MLSKVELRRYNRHIILPEFGREAQEKLKQARVLVIGAGGLGCPALQYLTAAGIGTIGIVDFDKVEESNLQRQVLFDTANIGRPKAEVAAGKLGLQNPYVNFRVHPIKLDRSNALALFADYDLVIDGSDNFPTRYLVSDVCTIQNKPLIFGSVFKFEGQVSVFNYTDNAGKKGPTYRCLFPEPPMPDTVPNCATIGVLGVLPGIIGTMQATEAIKVISGKGEPLTGKLLILDALTMHTSIIRFNSNSDNFKRTTLENDYEDFCHQNPIEEIIKEEAEVLEREITAEKLQKKLAEGAEIFILDVREAHEFEICHISGSLLIPMNSIPDQVHRIPKDRQVVVICHHGMRSARVIKFLTHEFNYRNLYNLEGGIDRWAATVDEEMERY
jgi:sulfur-carrier protein adenylyltransferase/sulfurtransferase